MRRETVRFGNRIAGAEKRAIRLIGGDQRSSVSCAAVWLLARFTLIRLAPAHGCLRELFPAASERI